MTKGLRLIISTPMTVLVDTEDVVSVRAEDESGSFGVLPHHVDFLTVLPASVVRWHAAEKKQNFCAVRAGLLTVSDGSNVAIACREGILGDDIAVLVGQVARLRSEEAEIDRRARVEEMRLHASAVRHLMQFLRPGTAGAVSHPPGIVAQAAPEGS